MHFVVFPEEELQRCQFRVLVGGVGPEVVEEGDAQGRPEVLQQVRRRD